MHPYLCDCWPCSRDRILRRFNLDADPFPPPPPKKYQAQYKFDSNEIIFYYKPFDKWVEYHRASKEVVGWHEQQVDYMWWRINKLNSKRYYKIERVDQEA